MPKYALLSLLFLSLPLAVERLPTRSGPVAEAARMAAADACDGADSACLPSQAWHREPVESAPAAAAWTSRAVGGAWAAAPADRPLPAGLPDASLALALLDETRAAGGMESSSGSFVPGGTGSADGPVATAIATGWGGGTAPARMTRRADWNAAPGGMEGIGMSGDTALGPGWEPASFSMPSFDAGLPVADEVASVADVAEAPTGESTGTPGTPGTPGASAVPSAIQAHGEVPEPGLAVLLGTGLLLMAAVPGRRGRS